MQGHEHFEELSALAAIGQLSAKEHSELLEHLRGCRSCRCATEDFAVVLDQLPLTEPILAADDTERLQTSSYRQRFLKRARAQGVRFSAEALDGAEANTRRSSTGKRIGLILAPVFAAVLIAVLLSRPPAVADPEPPQAAQAAPVSVKLEPNPLKETLAQLELDYQSSQSRVSELEASLARTLQELASARSQSQQESDYAAKLVLQLEQHLEKTRGALAQASAETEELRSSRDDLAATLVEQQIQMNELNQQAREQATTVERERQLAGLAGDLRGLMGARNLHIIDVFDADGRGRSRKSFGRVFYVEGQSLIFYAFDLSQKGGGERKVSFQAWGQREVVRNVAKDLGVFHIDDQEQKRWVLKVDDPEKLASIDSVFVTVERFGGSDRPTGAKLLYAYLGTPANHP